jgi:hypothetical protein
MASMQLADHCAGRDVQRRKQRGWTVTYVILSTPLGDTQGQRQHGLSTVQRPDLTLLIDAQHYGPKRWVKIQPGDVANLVEKQRNTGQVKSLSAMPLKAEGMPKYSSLSSETGSSRMQSSVYSSGSPPPGQTRAYSRSLRRHANHRSLGTRPDAAHRAIHPGDLQRSERATCKQFADSHAVSLRPSGCSCHRHRYVMLIRIPCKDNETFINTPIKHVRKLPQELYKSLTWDRGTEIAEHKRFTVATDIQLLLRPPASVAAQVKRKYNRSSMAVLPARHRSGIVFAG